ncbi:MAG: hypothetical protein DI589_22955 [Shinella sp.]|nr:MAG: hypothetical protein DI589_22955 [Shinella sp.]
MEGTDKHAVSATTPISQLVAAHIEASTNHNRAFDLIGWKVAKEGEFGNTIAPIDDAIIALCAARPSTLEEATLKREYLKQELYPVLDGNEGMTKRVVEALLNAASEPEATLFAETDQPTNLKGLMAALSVELMRWNGGGHRAVVYPADNEQKSSLQDLLLMPEEPGARPGSPSMVARKIATAQDNLLEAHSLTLAAMLATEDLPDSAAIQAVARAIQNKLGIARDQLEALREALS